MSGVDRLLAQAMAAPGWEVTRGTLRDEGDGLVLFAGGARVSPRWAEGYVPADGDNVLCVRVGETWYVLCHTIGSPSEPPPPPPSPPPARGTVTEVPVGSSRIAVSAGGQSYQAPFLGSYTPTVGNTVALLWTPGEDEPLVLGQPGAVPTPPPPDPPTPPPPPPPPPPVNPRPPRKQTGRERISATNSGSYMGSAWNSHFGRHLMQGSFSGPSNSGYWFYGSRLASSLRGRTVTNARIRLGARRRVGNYNSSITFTLRRHTSQSRPSGSPSLTGATVTVTVPAGGGARWVDLPASWYSGLASGHGVALVGSAYGGVVGAGSGSGYDAQSGLLDIRWER